MLISIQKQTFVTWLILLLTVWVVFSNVFQAPRHDVANHSDKAVAATCTHSKSMEQRVTKICQEVGSHFCGILADQQSSIPFISAMALFFSITLLRFPPYLHTIDKPPRSLAV